MGYSASVVLRRPARKDGTCQVRLLVILNGRSVPLGLGVSWPPTLFDEGAGRCLSSRPPKERAPTYAADLAAAQAWAGGPAELVKRCSDYNLLLGQAQGKANNVFVEYRLSSQPLSAEKFLQEYSTEGSKQDFIGHYYHKVIERHRKKKIGDITRKNHLSTWRALKAFQAGSALLLAQPGLRRRL